MGSPVLEAIKLILMSFGKEKGRYIKPNRLVKSKSTRGAGCGGRGGPYGGFLVMGSPVRVFHDSEATPF